MWLTPTLRNVKSVRVPWRTLRKIGLWVLGVVLTLALVVTGWVVWSVRHAFPDHDGAFALPGLSAKVTVYRDAYGVPQIYASTADDLFRAQGYIHAQDRFWEMDFRRHVTAGRLSELFGETTLDTDKVVRTTLSVSTVVLPNSSDSRPAVTCRRKSISQNRSWACT